MAILGGVVIGFSVSLMLLFNGKVTGVSGFLGGLLKKETMGDPVRYLFILGLLAGGVGLNLFYSEAFALPREEATFDYIIAGLLVGFGTRLGNGCTSGHGVCGISRFSKRSIASTITFIAFGIISFLLFKFIRGIP